MHWRADGNFEKNIYLSIFSCRNKKRSTLFWRFWPWWKTSNPKSYFSFHCNKLAAESGQNKYVYYWALIQCRAVWNLKCSSVFISMYVKYLVSRLFSVAHCSNVQPVHLSNCPPTCVFFSYICPSIPKSTCLYVHPSFYLSIHFFWYLFQARAQ